VTRRGSITGPTETTQAILANAAEEIEFHDVTLLVSKLAPLLAGHLARAVFSHHTAGRPVQLTATVRPVGQPGNWVGVN